MSDFGFINNNNKGSGGVSDYNSLSNKPIIKLFGTEDKPVLINNLNSGNYLLSGKFGVEGNFTTWDKPQIVFLDVITSGKTIFMYTKNGYFAYSLSSLSNTWSLKEHRNAERPFNFDTMNNEESDSFMRAYADNSKTEPYYDEQKSSVFACGVLITVEDNDGNTINVSWLDHGQRKKLTVPNDTNIFGGGDGLEYPVFYNATSILFASGTVRNIFGGNLGYGSVGSSTIVMNKGKTLNSNNAICGGGASFHKGNNYRNFVGITNIIINGTSSPTIVWGAGGTGYASTGSSNVTINGGSISWLTGAGSNGITSSSNVVVNGGNIQVLQGCNRGHVSTIKIEVNNGNIDNLYAGGETTDTNVNATYNKSQIFINGGRITNLQKGTNGGVEDATKVSGTYVDGVITNIDNVSNLNLVRIEKLEDMAGLTNEEINTIISGIFDK